jgi:hypothetical protein
VGCYISLSFITLKKTYLYASTPTKIMRLHKVTVSPCKQGGGEGRGRRETPGEKAIVICFEQVSYFIVLYNSREGIGQPSHTAA